MTASSPQVILDGAPPPSARTLLSLIGLGLLCFVGCIVTLLRFERDSRKYKTLGTSTVLASHLSRIMQKQVIRSLLFSYQKKASLAPAQLSLLLF